MPHDSAANAMLHDVHAHLTHPDLLAQIDDIVGRAQAAGLRHIVSNGLNPDDNMAVLALAERFPNLIRPALGFYPVDTCLRAMRAQGVETPHQDRDIDPDEGIAWLAQHAHKAFAIGEIGLDGYWVPEPFWPEQERIFMEAVQVAQNHNLPIIIHTRKRERRTFDLLSEAKISRVNWHCYSSKLKLARQIAEAGHYLSIPANAHRAENFTRMLQKLPAENLLLETDCPYLAPTPGGQSEPAHTHDTAALAAKIWEMPIDKAHQIFADNFDRLFFPKS